MSLEQAIATLKAAGYRVSKPRAPKVKDRVGPTFEALFADGTVTRMSIFTSLADLDLGRGVRLSVKAWEARSRLEQWEDDRMPVIVAARFEQDGMTLREYTESELTQ